MLFDRDFYTYVYVVSAFALTYGSPPEYVTKYPTVIRFVYPGWLDLATAEQPSEQLFWDRYATVQSDKEEKREQKQGYNKSYLASTFSVSDLVFSK